MTKLLLFNTLSSAHKIISYCTFYVGQSRRDTIEKVKDANPSFPETFHFVVGDKDQDVLQVKVKQHLSFGKLSAPVCKVLAVIEIRVKSVTEAPNMRLVVTEDLSNEPSMVEGASFSCDLKYRPTAKLYNIANNFAN